MLVPMSDILFIKTSSLGDVIHHMPALTEARRHRPTARFAWVVEEAFAPLVQLHPEVSEVIAVATRRWRKKALGLSTWREMAGFRRAIRERGYDDVIDSQGLIRSALMARMALGRRHGYDANSIREPVASWLYDVQHAVARDLHAIARNRMLTGLALGYAPAGPVDDKAVWDQLRQCYDPEIPVNIVDLGLVYDCQLKPSENGGTKVEVKMTLTAPGCGMGPAIAHDAQSKIMSIEGVDEAQVDLVWDPPWNQNMISEAGRMKLGMV